MAEGYVDPDFTDYEDYLTTLVYVEPSEGVSFKKVVEDVCGESSIGTWTDVA
ncbi:MAG TPA: ribulose-bisphosphate carboxylase large subunit, partial [Candidatus Altiarchaeales archaeon]|nr:ribulose-bisphosphate carboxylase large subunit [Candidatus Altiarchaeales archaeon]